MFLNDEQRTLIRKIDAAAEKSSGEVRMCLTLGYFCESASGDSVLLSLSS